MRNTNTPAPLHCHACRHPLSECDCTAPFAVPAPRAVDAVTHTPGPWHVDMRAASGGDAFIWGPDGSQRGYIARVNLCAVERTDQTAREANARLMAAAPALHAYIVRRLNERFAQIAAAGHAYDSTADNDTEVIELRALLALARGEA
jgi:hypothetical protein